MGKTVAVKIDHSKPGYITVPVDHWEKLMQLIIETGNTVKFLYDEDHPGDTGC